LEVENAADAEDSCGHNVGYSSECRSQKTGADSRVAVEDIKNLEV
jgi:hypothetical protein